MAEFGGGVGGIVHGRGDFGADEFTEARAQTVDRDFHGGLAHAERPCGFGLRTVRTAAEPLFQRREMRGFLRFKRGERAGDDGMGPVSYTHLTLPTSDLV